MKFSETFSVLIKYVKMRVFRSQCTFLLLADMYIELQVHSACLVCTCFQALVFWCFCMRFGAYLNTTVQCKASVVQHKHFVARLDVNCRKKKSLKFLRRVIKSPWEVLEFFARKSVRTLHFIVVNENKYTCSVLWETSFVWFLFLLDSSRQYSLQQGWARGVWWWQSTGKLCWKFWSDNNNDNNCWTHQG